MANLQKPNVFNYHDHINFLKDYVVYMKNKGRGFSLRKFASEIDVATGYLSMCFTRKRRLSKNAFDKIILKIELNKREKEFLELLWLMGESESAQVRSQTLAQIGKYKEYSSLNREEFEVHKYLSCWQIVAVREMVQLKNFKNDPTWIKRRLRGRIATSEIKEILQFLIKNKFVEQHANGELTIADKVLKCFEGVYKLSLGDFHRQMLGLAAQSIEEHSRDKRLILGHTLAIDSQDFAKVKSILENAQSELEKLNNMNKNADDIVHISLAAFPLTNSVDQEEPNV